MRRGVAHREVTVLLDLDVDEIPGSTVETVEITFQSTRSAPEWRAVRLLVTGPRRWSDLPDERGRAWVMRAIRSNAPAPVAYEELPVGGAR